MHCNVHFVPAINGERWGRAYIFSTFKQTLNAEFASQLLWLINLNASFGWNILHQFIYSLNIKCSNLSFRIDASMDLNNVQSDVSFWYLIRSKITEPEIRQRLEFSNLNFSSFKSNINPGAFHFKSTTKLW